MNGPKTATRKAKEKRDRKVKATFQALASSPGAMKTACVAEVMKRFRLSRATVWRIIVGGGVAQVD
ncbi:hypothetical protein [Spirosoma panaciterrae]|uniref:hypothetical protein n=1 Tax=Spirosoma panaciterrae TaxID=496058 RepID=UPI00036C5909|nr:hypothetical protein [Spirosoma panaciterrae]